MGVDVSTGIAYGVKVSEEELYEGLKNYLLARPNIKYNPEEDDIEDYKEYLEDEIICLNAYVKNSNYIIGYCIDEVDEDCETISLSDLQLNYDDRYEIEHLIKEMFPNKNFVPSILLYQKWW
jgi:hypothetical protein